MQKIKFTDLEYYRLDNEFNTFGFIYLHSLKNSITNRLSLEDRDVGNLEITILKTNFEKFPLVDFLNLSNEDYFKVAGLPCLQDYVMITDRTDPSWCMFRFNCKDYKTWTIKKLK